MFAAGARRPCRIKPESRLTERRRFDRDTEPIALVVRLDRRTYSPVLRQADLPPTLTIPWLDGRTLGYEYA